MGVIQLLPEELSHKIAAGEVVERPASVVKELVENSLDAQSERIDVTIEEGGQEFIQVSDDGIGIAEDDLERAFMRHATSKIRTVSDLFSIQSLGFRGEALPSIASVSEMTLLTRTRDVDRGYAVSFKDGSAEKHPAGTRPGTTVEVRRLFYNTPARYKFLKSPSSERREIADLMAKFGIAHPHVAFRLTADEREIFHTPGSGDQLDAIAAAYGRNRAQQVLKLEHSAQWGSVTGCVAPPKINKGNRREQVVILNGRLIQAPAIVYAAERAYQGMLPQRRFPFFVLVITVDPETIDVNVHPTKAEVRFQNERQLASEINQAVRQALQEADLSTAMDRSQKTPGQSGAGSSESRQTSFPFSGTSPQPEKLWSPRSWEQVDAILRENSGGQDQIAPKAPLGQQKPDSWPRQDGTADHDGEQAALREHRQSNGATSHGPGDGEDCTPTAASAGQQARDRLLNGRIIGQLYQSYILLETDQGLWILDQHIVHERLLYERFLAAEKQRPTVQQILPVTLEFSTGSAEAVRQHLDTLAALGLELEEFGPSAFLLRGVPQELSRTSGAWEQDILDIAEEVDSDHRWQGKAALTMACRGAVKAGEYLDQRQIHSLLRQLADADDPFHCPHGRPIIVRLDHHELQRRFGRV